jgi:hypothetical protein
MSAVDWRGGEHGSKCLALYKGASNTVSGLSYEYVPTVGQGDDRPNFRAAFPQLGEGHFLRYPFYRHVSGLRRGMQFTV